LAVSSGGLAVGAIGFVVLIFQLAQVNRALRVNAQAAIYQQGSDARRALVDHPELRPYILGGEPIDAGSAHYDRAVTVAEMFLNYHEQTLVNMKTFERRDGAAWTRFIAASLERSPLMVRLLRENPQFYVDDLVKLV
jgi:hypothetical protein